MNKPSTLLVAGNQLERMLLSQRIVIAIGAGGVGKTTSSVALAVHAAQMGRRVALLSIDPAKRLAAALGLELGHELRPLIFPSYGEVSGSVHAAMLDQKAVFDGMVRKHAPSPRIADKILRDPLYIAASTNLSGPLEYMALARLQELSDDPSYDLVVVDTPPDAHAMDFLARPNVLSGFVENKVVSKLLKPVVLAGKLGLGGIASVSEKVLGGVSSITGFSALKTFAEFILLMQEVIDGFHRSGERVLELLRRPSTSFVLVAAPHKSAVRAAEALIGELRRQGYDLEGVLLNRCLSDVVMEQASKSQSPEAVMLETRFKGEQRVTQRLQEFIGTGLDQSQPWIHRVHEFVGEIHSMKGILEFSKGLGTTNTHR